MSISVSCLCGKTLRVKDAHAGKRVKCPECARIVVVPKPSTTVPSVATAIEDLAFCLLNAPAKSRKSVPSEESDQPLQARSHTQRIADEPFRVVSGDSPVLYAKIKLPGKIYDTINRNPDGPPNGIRWPSTTIKTQAGSNCWKDWRPSAGDIGEVIGSARHPNGGTVYLLKVGQYYVPMDEHGVELVPRIDAAEKIVAERMRQEEQKRKEEEARKAAASKNCEQEARALSRQLNDAAIRAVRAGDNQTAMKKWVEAATADPTFSGPPFNMARFMLDKGARRPDELRVVEKYLDAAERNAVSSNEDEDARILDQLPTLRAWLASRRNTIDI